VRYLGGFWVVWVCACLPLAVLPYGRAVERQYDGLQQLVANVGPLAGVLLIAGLAWHLVVTTRRPGTASDPTPDETAAAPKLTPPAVG
jgi:alpha-1,2-mannosyltransferase